MEVAAGLGDVAGAGGAGVVAGAAVPHGWRQHLVGTTAAEAEAVAEGGLNGAASG